MTPNQKKFWNILREPYIKNCRNCKYSYSMSDPHRRLGVTCNEPIYMRTGNKTCYFMNETKILNYPKWKWDKKAI